MVYCFCPTSKTVLGHKTGFQKKQKTNFVEYVNKIFIHGCLHLVGYEHDNLKNYKEMHSLERKLLAIV